jgi:putative hydrolase of the HAD superfamily
MKPIPDVKGVFLDYGGVVEDAHPDDVQFLKGVSIISGILKEAGIALDATSLAEKLRSGQSAYNSWYNKNDFRELPNEDIWTDFFLQDACRDNRTKNAIREKAEELSSIYEFYLYKRRPPSGMPNVLKSLFQNRFVIALVSNTMSNTLIPARLKKYGVDRYFATVVLSVEEGVRKPNKAIFEPAFRQTGLKPSKCVYVGDTLSRDVQGSRRAGFKNSILLRSGLTEVKDSDFKGDVKPDHVIDRLKDLKKLLLP